MQLAARRRQGFSHVLPVVEQNVRSPDLVCGETQVLHPRMFTLVPLEVVVEPALKHTQTRTQCGLQRAGEDWCSHYLGLCFTGTRVLMMGLTAVVCTLNSKELKPPQQRPHHCGSLPSGAICWW